LVCSLSFCSIFHSLVARGFRVYRKIGTADFEALYFDCSRVTQAVARRQNACAFGYGLNECRKTELAGLNERGSAFHETSAFELLE
jgi:hypothetical protein